MMYASIVPQLPQDFHLPGSILGRFEKRLTVAGQAFFVLIWRFT